MKDFARNHFKNSAYTDLKDNERMRILFSNYKDIPNLIEGLQVEAGQRIIPNETLLILDEVQEVPEALSSLQIFCDKAPEYHVLAGSSLLGSALQKGAAVLFGKVDFLALYPMCFFEFLEAIGQEALVKLLRDGNWSLRAYPKIISEAPKKSGVEAFARIFSVPFRNFRICTY
jgi:predicted AAA+ superfamily ATPase